MPGLFFVNLRYSAEENARILYQPGAFGSVSKAKQDKPTSK